MLWGRAVVVIIAVVLFNCFVESFDDLCDFWTLLAKSHKLLSRDKSAAISEGEPAHRLMKQISLARRCYEEI